MVMGRMAEKCRLVGQCGASSENGCQGRLRATKNMITTTATDQEKIRFDASDGRSFNASRHPIIGISNMFLDKLPTMSPCSSEDSALVLPHPGQYTPVRR